MASSLLHLLLLLANSVFYEWYLCFDQQECAKMSIYFIKALKQSKRFGITVQCAKVASSQPNCFEVPFALDTGKSLVILSECGITNICKCDVSPDGALIWRWRIGVPHWFHCRFAYHESKKKFNNDYNCSRLRLDSGRQRWCPYSSCQRGSASCLHCGLGRPMLSLPMPSCVQLDIKAFPSGRSVPWYITKKQVFRWASWQRDNSSWHQGVLNVAYNRSRCPSYPINQITSSESRRPYGWRCVLVEFAMKAFHSDRRAVLHIAKSKNVYFNVSVRNCEDQKASF
ncbi:hypothetical protein T11_9796 [Trichinella zimbabwensis]|uniref:Uncharacterized protein n=1 Tax=Trichinella zimbabwensis TaxID=268475 RepID=A0A0V1GT15_9BILA|nr:hypothetical protein T11_9796 [Trichinella zimbabwensis]